MARVLACRRRLATCLCVGVVALLVCACGSARHNQVSPDPIKHVKPPEKATHVVDVYLSVPRSGPQRAIGTAIIRGFRLGLAAGPPSSRISDYSIHAIPANDSTARGWSASKVLKNAKLAARDPRTVLYVGDLDSGATELSAPILNQAGIAQITPGSGYVGLTTAVKHVTQSGEPGIFKPTGKQTLLRLIPDDMVQAAAVLDTFKTATGCSRVTAVSTGTAIDGPELVSAISVTAKEDYDMSFVSAKLSGSSASDIEAYVSGLVKDGVSCVAITGRATSESVALAEEVHALAPRALIIGTSGLCNARFTDPSRGGVPADLDDYVYCTSPIFPLSKYHDHARGLISAYRDEYGAHATVNPYAAYGYVIGEMVSGAVEGLGGSADSRLSVQRTLLDGGGHFSELFGEFYFDSDGDLASSDSYALYRIGSGGQPEYYKAVKPPRIVSG